MSAKTIKKVIKAKLADWVKHVDDESVADLIRRHAVVTGGCIASMLLGEEVKDFDVYLDSREVALQRMAHAQWHFDEIATGEPFARMKAEGWGPRWH
jgi:tRNA nucleotidyltransferase/poly(A) polymerase